MQKYDDILDQLKGGKISRREFMQRSIAAGASVAMASSLAGQAMAAEPKKGGKFRIGLGHGSTTDTFDPATVENDYTIMGTWVFRGHLTEVDENDQLSGDLAESWDVSDDAKTWVFKLRDGVEFHNGKTLDANDVVASLNYHRGEDSKSAAKPIVAGVQEIKATDKGEVTVVLDSGNADFPYIVSDYHLAIMPADNEGKVDWTTHIGTGGYVLQDWDPGIRASFKRNPNFYKSGKANFDEVEMLVVADIVARTNALTTGDLDLMDRCDIKTVHLLERNTEVSVKETSGTAHYTIPMLTDTPPYDNNDLRLAIKYACDREAMVKTILRGHGAVGNDHPIGRSNQYHAGDLEQRSYDIDKAKFHLKKAGYDSINLELHASDAAFGGAVDAAILLKEHAAPAGIDISVIREPADGYWADHWMKTPWIMSYWAGRPTEDWMFATAYAAGAAWNETRFNHPRFEELLLEGRSELNPERRRQIYFEMQQIVRDEGGELIPMFNNYVFAARANVMHGNLSAAWAQDGQKAAERWWFA
jgi:peptide/nickel transport system substrate-binding protein